MPPSVPERVLESLLGSLVDLKEEHGHWWTAKYSRHVHAICFVRPTGQTVSLELDVRTNTLSSTYRDDWKQAAQDGERSPLGDPAGVQRVLDSLRPHVQRML